MLTQKHVNANFYYIFFMPSWYRVHGALKNAKAENIFYDDFSMQVQGDEHANPKMQCKI
jgi:hypothetical protein